MRQVSYVHDLGGGNVLRVRFELEHGRVVAFVVQLECYFEYHDWLPVIRYDTAHGFAHRDTMHPKEETKKTEIAVDSYEEGVNYAIDDIKANWLQYRRRYEKWLES